PLPLFLDPSQPGVLTASWIFYFSKNRRPKAFRPPKKGVEKAPPGLNMGSCEMRGASTGIQPGQSEENQPLPGPKTRSRHCLPNTVQDGRYPARFIRTMRFTARTWSASGERVGFSPAIAARFQNQVIISRSK